MRIPLSPEGDSPLRQNLWIKLMTLRSPARPSASLGIIVLGLFICILAGCSASQAAAPTQIATTIPSSATIPPLPTNADQSVQSSVDQLFTQTAQAQQQIAATQTINAALNQAETATTAFQNTVQAQFNRQLQATIAANLTQTADLPGLRFHLPANWDIHTEGQSLLEFGQDASANHLVSFSNLGAVQLKSGQIVFLALDYADFTPDPLLQNLQEEYPNAQITLPTPVSVGIFNGTESIFTSSDKLSQMLVRMLNWQNSEQKKFSLIFIAFVAPGELDADRPQIDAILSHVESIAPTSTPH